MRNLGQCVYDRVPAVGTVPYNGHAGYEMYTHACLLNCHSQPTGVNKLQPRLNDTRLYGRIPREPITHAAVF